MKPFLSRRCFCLSTLLGPAFLGAAPVRARQVVPPDPANLDVPAQTLYLVGVRMLREGRTFEKAAARFALAAQKEPNEASYRIAEGCAWASRAASLSRAALFQKNLFEHQAAFPQRLKEWEEGRADWEKSKAQNPQVYAFQNYDDTKPERPPAYAFVTKDDKAPFRLTVLETAARVSELVGRAQAAWTHGIALAKTPEETAEAFYTQAWGLNVLRYALLGLKRGEEGEKTLSPAPPLVDIIKAAEEAVRLAPENALYRQAVGDLLGDTDKEKAFAAYEKAATLAPKNANLNYLMFQRTMEKILQEGAGPQWDAYVKGEKQKPDETLFAVPLHYLHRAAGRDRANAWAWYEEAGILFTLAPYARTGASGLRNATPQQTQGALDSVLNASARKRGKRAVDLIVRGNALPHYATPQYEYSVPPLLKQAWLLTPYSYFLSDEGYNTFAHLRELARAVGGYAHIMAANENNLAEAVRASRAAIAMGFHVVGDWPDTKNPPTETKQMEKLVGVTLVLISYRIFIKMYQKINDAEGADAVQKELDDFEKWDAAYRKAYHAFEQNVVAGY